MERLLLTSICMVFAPFAGAQSIDVGELGAASAYDVGLIEPGQGALDAALWQGTSARMAAHLIENAPLDSDNSGVQTLVRAAILSGGVPPENATPETLATYNAVRLRAVMNLGNKAMLDRFVDRSPGLATDPVAAANIALASGDGEAACFVTDGVTEGRSEPQWARLRAFCHVMRDEAAAAELTTELLKANGYKDSTYFSLMRVLTGASKRANLKNADDDPLYVVMAEAANVSWPEGEMPKPIASKIALDGEAESEDRLQALYRAGSKLTNEQIVGVLNALTFDETETVGESYDFDSVKSLTSAKSVGQLYTLAKSGNAQATAELLARADKAGAFSRFAQLLAADITVIPVAQQVETNLPLFTRTAIARADLGTLQGLYQTMDGQPGQNRIALISDALGNGFVLGALGQHIETRLEENGEVKTRAVRDTVIALALGSQLSDEAALALEDSGNSSGHAAKTGDLMALRAAASAGARAETALRAAMILDAAGPQDLDNLSIYMVIKALSDAGLTSFAGRVAADDFWQGLAG